MCKPSYDSLSISHELLLTILWNDAGEAPCSIVSYGIAVIRGNLQAQIKQPAEDCLLEARPSYDDPDSFIQDNNSRATRWISSEVCLGETLIAINSIDPCDEQSRCSCPNQSSVDETCHEASKSGHGNTRRITSGHITVGDHSKLRNPSNARGEQHCL